MNLSLTTMQYFVDIVDENSFTKAAEKNYVAQTALSHAIAKLEKELGSSLLIRGRGQVIPTEAGKVFYEECRMILGIHSKKYQQIKRLQKNEKQIRIGFIDIYECKDYKKIKDRLAEKFPSYTFDWVDRYSVDDDDLDIVIRYSYEPELKAAVASSERISVSGDNLCYLVAKDVRASKEEVLTESWLRAQDILILLRNRAMDFGKVQYYMKRRGFVNLYKNFQYVYSAFQRRTLVEAGEGIAVFEKNLFRYDPNLCECIPLLEPGEIFYIIDYKDKKLQKIVTEIESFFK